ncbi:hypothetical protein KW786_03510 [Candidatus Parcubacteria bacterium]|nr:hypothetical protein [Candidatus Parcubacteria bacterium]
MISLFVLLVYMVSLLGAVYIPDVFIPSFLNYLRHKRPNVKEYAHKYKEQDLRIYTKWLGDSERLLFWMLAMFGSYEGLVTFFIFWTSLKVATNYQLFLGIKKEERHLGRALFHISLIGNIASLVSVMVVVFITKYVLKVI